MHGMVNTCELSINVVMSTKPKMLPGLSQKGTGAGTGSREYPVMDTQRARRRGSAGHPRSRGPGLLHSLPIGPSLFQLLLHLLQGDFLRVIDHPVHFCKTTPTFGHLHDAGLPCQGRHPDVISLHFKGGLGGLARRVFRSGHDTV